MAADARLEAGGTRERRPAIWPWLLMPLIVLLVFCALARMHHRPGTPWAGSWAHPPANDASRPPTR
ncbi:MAG TPA: hypothetical protein VEG26_03655 [Steroidobacteraceae bacterium]|nr:hypothetical protein [Steroidobacteraceae bacterium]